MKRNIIKGSTSKMIDIFIQDTSQTDGSGLTGLAYNTGSLTAYYYRNGAGSAVQISLVTATLGTFASGGFVVIDGTNMPGNYQLGVPNAALASGADSVLIVLKGATNMAQVEIEIQLDNDPATIVQTGVDAALDAANTELASVPSAGTATLRKAIQWLYSLARHKVTETDTTRTVMKADGSTTLATSTISDNGTTLTKGADS